MKKILITGASGMLGKDVAEVFPGDYEVYCTDLRITEENEKHIAGDLTDETFVKSLLDMVQPDLIIHCAAIVNVNLCEQDKTLCENVHIKATKYLAQNKKAKIVYISTDSVFDGVKGGFKETDQVMPQNYYAKTKLLGESQALRNPNSLVIRTNIYGFNKPAGKSLAEWALGELNSGKQVNGFSDVYFNPLYTAQLAQIIKGLVDADKEGIFHAASTTKLSKFEFVRSLANAFGLDEKSVSPVLIDEVFEGAKRPKNSSLSIAKITPYVKNKKNLLIKEGLKEFALDYKKAFGE